MAEAAESSIFSGPGEDPDDENPVPMTSGLVEKEKEHDLNQQLRMKMGFSAKAVDDYTLVKTLKERTDPIGRWRYKIHLLLRGQWVDGIVGVVIVVNSITIGMQTSFEIEGRDTTIFDQIEYVYVAIYTIELGLRVFASRWLCFQSGWVRFDALLVAVAYFSLIVEPLIRGMTNIPLGILRILKMLRISRLLRAVRLIAQFRVMWELVRGLLNSMNMILSTCILMSFILYIYACIGLELLTKERDHYDGMANDLIDYHFGDMYSFMLSLIQFSTFDSAAAIYIPLVYQEWYMLVYFISFMLVVGIALMNLLTALIIESSFEMTRNDKDVQQALKNEMLKKLLPRLLSLFRDLDKDGSGDISLDEIEDAPPEVRAEMGKLLGDDQLEEIFRIIDFDGSGEIGIDEFFDNISKVVTGSLNINDMRMQHQISAATNGIREQIAELEKKVLASNACERIEELERKLLARR